MRALDELSVAGDHRLRGRGTRRPKVLKKSAIGPSGWPKDMPRSLTPRKTITIVDARQRQHVAIEARQCALAAAVGEQPIAADPKIHDAPRDLALIAIGEP